MSDGSLTFLVAPCVCRCGEEALATRALDASGALEWSCLHCGAPIDERGEGARWAEAGSLSAIGYDVPGYERAPEPGVESRGCRGGSCGVRQPERDPL